MGERQLHLGRRRGRSVLVAVGLTRSDLISQSALNRLIEGVWMEAEWTGLALIKHAASGSNQVQPVGPACICRFDTVVEVVNECGKPNVKLANTRACDEGTLCLVLRAAEKHLVADVRLHLPDIGWMRLKDVDGVERNLALVLLGQLVQGGNLPPKWRSRVAPEDQDDGL